MSRAVRIGPFVSVSGTAPLAPDGRTVCVGDPAGQARRCLEIIEAALRQALRDMTEEEAELDEDALDPWGARRADALLKIAESYKETQAVQA